MYLLLLRTPGQTLQSPEAALSPPLELPVRLEQQTSSILFGSSALSCILPQPDRLTSKRLAGSGLLHLTWAPIRATTTLGIACST